LVSGAADQRWRGQAGPVVGLGRDLDLILIGRPVAVGEALTMGMANRVVESGHAVATAIELAEQIAAFPL
jgi:enoyl-CoA hydratase